MAAPHAPTITGGRWRGRRLTVAQGLVTRPTRSLVRQALFNMLGPRVLDAVVLDLYSGSGALGLEALSRGAARVVFVERHPKALAALRKNLASCAPEPGTALLLSVDAASLSSLPESPFDLITADPPFALIDAIPALISAPEAVAPGATLAYHGPSERAAPPAPAAWSFDRTRVHGRSSWHLFLRDQAAHDGGEAPPGHA